MPRPPTLRATWKTWRVSLCARCASSWWEGDTSENDVRLAQCESIAQLRAAVRGRLGILRPHNDESVTLWVAKHVRGRDKETDLPKRR